ncbi:MAG: HepT-like ribonuclease domain-containing protein [Candidatus Poribacteria bacterium]
MIHHYFGIDYSLVWDIIKSHLPRLKLDIESIINETKDDE